MMDAAHCSGKLFVSVTSRTCAPLERMALMLSGSTDNLLSPLRMIHFLALTSGIHLSSSASCTKYVLCSSTSKPMRSKRAGNRFDARLRSIKITCPNLGGVEVGNCVFDLFYAQFVIVRQIVHRI